MNTFNSSTMRVIVDSPICRDKFAQTDKPILKVILPLKHKNIFSKHNDFSNIMAESDLNFQEWMRLDVMCGELRVSLFCVCMYSTHTLKTWMDP